MHQIEHAAPPAWLVRLAGGLLIAMGLVIVVYPQVQIITTYGPSWLWYSIPVALVISLPPVLVGIGVLRWGSEVRRIGIGVTLVGAVAFGNFLARDSHGPYTPLWAMVLATNIIVLAILAMDAAASFLQGRSERS